MKILNEVYLLTHPKDKEKIDTLDFNEFKLFLDLLRQYYVYCQVFSLFRNLNYCSFKVLNNDDIDPYMMISKKDFKAKEDAVKDFLGTEFDVDTFDELFTEAGEQTEFCVLVEALIKEYVGKERNVEEQEQEQEPAQI